MTASCRFILVGSWAPPFSSFEGLYSHVFFTLSNATAWLGFLEHPQLRRQNPTPIVLFQWFWDEPGLCRSKVDSESHGTFPCLALEVHLMPFFHPLLEGPHLVVHVCQCTL
jgi:hypothetical protein